MFPGKFKDNESKNSHEDQRTNVTISYITRVESMNWKIRKVKIKVPVRTKKRLLKTSF